MYIFVPCRAFDCPIFCRQTVGVYSGVCLIQAGQAASLAITMDGTPEHAHAFHQESRGYAAEAPSAQFLMGAPGMMTDYCSPGLPGLNLSAQIQVNNPVIGEFCKSTYSEWRTFWDLDVSQWLLWKWGSH